MGGISDDQVEWAVVHRLKAMLDDPPETKFNVTQTFAHFILLWTTQRIRVLDMDVVGPADHAAQQVLRNLHQQQITDSPWGLSRLPPALEGADILGDERDVNAAFVGMTVGDFTIWLRNALAHGDGRTITPIHKRSLRTGKDYLAGFRIAFAQERHAERILTLHLYHQDIVRIGKSLAENFCRMLREGDAQFNAEAMLKLSRASPNHDDHKNLCGIAIGMTGWPSSSSPRTRLYP